MPAVLEQWEIDLRNQLLEGSQSEREWEERLRNELQDVPSRKKRKKETPTIKKRKCSCCREKQKEIRWSVGILFNHFCFTCNEFVYLQSKIWWCYYQMVRE